VTVDIIVNEVEDGVRTLKGTHTETGMGFNEKLPSGDDYNAYLASDEFDAKMAAKKASWDVDEPHDQPDPFGVVI